MRSQKSFRVVVFIIKVVQEQHVVEEAWDNNNESKNVEAEDEEYFGASLLVDVPVAVVDQQHHEKEVTQSCYPKDN